MTADLFSGLPVAPKVAQTETDPSGAAAAAQAIASRPAVSSWVSASAGSGKTYVLTQRVLRLLLDGAPPAGILCLTFTKAAAAEMTHRVALRLGEWALKEDAALVADLTNIAGAPPTDVQVRRARQLFATCLDVPGGMRIQTIHAFCQALLKRFPLEAGVPPHFQVIEEGDQRALLDSVRNRVLADAAPGRGRFADDLAQLTTVGGPDDLTSLLGALLRHRGRLSERLKDDASVADAVAQLYRDAGLDPAETAASIKAAACLDGAVDHAGLTAAADALRDGGKANAERGVILSDWLAADPDTRAAGFGIYAAVFLTGAGTVRASLATKKAQDANPAALDILTAEAERLCAVNDRIASLTIVERSAALLRLGAAVHQQYEAAKARRAVLDFDDLILKAEDLLTGRVATEWVLFKLDGGIDHILVDEAQDTSPDQWRLVSAIAEEFFAGAGVERRERPDQEAEQVRTIFAVGDAKQSIYSFQGADPVVFDVVRQAFGARVRAAEAQWMPVDLDVSFRSVQQVLDAVDRTFATGAARDGVVDGDANLKHTAFRAGQSGLVELWPVIAPADKDAPETWTTPQIDTDTVSPTVVLARRLAHQVRGWINGQAALVWDRSVDPPVRRAPRARDVMILVRRRTELVEELIRSLKAEDIDVAGADRMVLIEQLAVMDLMAVADFLLLPDDDLTLATVLKGPLFGFDDDQLFALAHGRGAARLWSRLRDAHDGPATMAADVLSGLLRLADFTPPFELLKAILTAGERPNGRARFWGRLGPDALEPIEELLNLALIYQQDHPPSLQAFLHWLRARDVEIKRDMDSVPDAVRIMTVHGSKGLQAPVVILPDTTRLPRTGDRLTWEPKDGALPLVTPSSTDADARTAALKEAAKEAQRQEYNRLLYVAMTRAEDALIVCGHRGTQKADDQCWHQAVEAGLRALDGTQEIDVDGFDGPVLRYGTLPDHVAPAAAVGSVDDQQDDRLTGLLQKPLPEDEPPMPLAPSRPDGEEPPVFGPFDPSGDRFRRGAIIHRLLQSLPDVPAARRAALGAQFLARPAHGLSGQDQQQMLDETLAVMDLPAAAALFGPGSMAEAPVTGVVGSSVISGQIDRLAIGPDRVAIVDYKTNRPPPQDPADVPQVYLRQMAAYRALLQQLYPDRSVDCFLLWTAIPHLMALESGQLDRYAPAA